MKSDLRVYVRVMIYGSFEDPPSNPIDYLLVEQKCLVNARLNPRETVLFARRIRNFILRFHSRI